MYFFCIFGHSINGCKTCICSVILLPDSPFCIFVCIVIHCHICFAWQRVPCGCAKMLSACPCALQVSPVYNHDPSHAHAESKATPKVSKGRAESPLVHPQVHPLPTKRTPSQKRRGPRTACPASAAALEGSQGHRNAPAIASAAYAAALPAFRGWLYHA